MAVEAAELWREISIAWQCNPERKEGEHGEERESYL
jgi:hypothetical protein